MELIFNHRFGRVEQQDLVVSDVLAIVEPEDDGDETNMLDQGWLAHDRPYQHHGRSVEVFYQCRSTRIDIERFRPRYSAYTIGAEPLQMKEIFPRRREDTVWTGMHQLYDQYIKRKGYKNLYDPFEHINERDSFLVFYVGDVTNLVGFTKIKRYDWQESMYHKYPMLVDPDWVQEMNPHALESVMHCNNQPIGQLTMDMEIAWAKQQDAIYYYAGAGYERSSIYKSLWTGFEWWTGTRWSRSKREYKRLCERDSALRSISDLGGAK